MALKDWTKISPSQYKCRDEYLTIFKIDDKFFIYLTDNPSFYTYNHSPIFVTDSYETAKIFMRDYRRKHSFKSKYGKK